VKQIIIFARMGIRPENVEQVKALAAKACKVAADQPGTLCYDWHYSKEQGCLVLLESYADSHAHLAHMRAEGHGEFMGRLMALIDSLGFVVLGEPTPEHAAALSSVPGAQFFSEVAGVYRPPITNRRSG
jgi:quinol monooxygenase YgiN